MKIYNTLTRQKEEFKTIVPNEVKMYACGPTVYNYIHIGNARPICVFDTLRRYLEYAGYKVTFAQNFTDVDDKIIKKANEENVPASEISERFIAEYKKDAAGLNIKPATVHPKVTENMDIIIDFIKTLVDKNFAYESNGDVYFKTTEFSEYGKLSHMPLEDLEAGARIDVSEQKQNAMDFALWKSAKPGEPYWDSPWGKGRPGWHIECSAMAKNYLGDTIDLHCGGQDLIFPHHENEIAQSECANGCEFSHYWMHNGYINVDNKKMSKSAGNFFTVREIADKFGYEPIRFMMLQAHYRTPVNYSTDIIEQCRSALDRLYNCRDSAVMALKTLSGSEISNDVSEIAKKRKQQFKDAMEDDFNTADAISAVFELVRDINAMISGQNETKSELELLYTLFCELTDVLGLVYESSKEKIPDDVLKLADERAKARKEKNFELADKLRDQITQMGYVIEETRQGTKISKAK